MLTPAGVPLLWPCRWRFRLLSWFPKRATNWNVLSAWHYFLVGMDAPFITRKQRCSLVIEMINTLQIQFHRLIKHQVEYKKAKITFLE